MTGLEWEPKTVHVVLADLPLIAKATYFNAWLAGQFFREDDVGWLSSVISDIDLEWWPFEENDLGVLRHQIESHYNGQFPQIMSAAHAEWTTFAADVRMAFIACFTDHGCRRCPPWCQALRDELEARANPSKEPNDSEGEPEAPASG